MIDENLCDICFEVINNNFDSFHPECNNVSYLNKFKNVENFNEFKSLVKKYFLGKTNLEAKNESDILERPGFIILNKNIVALSMKSCNLKEFPLEVTCFTRLRILNLSQNKISSIPPEINKLVYLKKLIMKSNSFSKLPNEIQFLKKIFFLNLSNNHFSDLPKELFSLTNLDELIINDNFISEIPSEISNLKMLKKIELKNNKLTKLTKNLQLLPYLEFIFITVNDALLKNYPNIKFSDNQEITNLNRIF